VDVTLVHSTGTTTAQVQVVVNDPPALQLADSVSEGGLLTNAIGLDLTMGADVGDIHFLSFSGSLNPSVLPGFLSFGIGNNFTSLFSLGNYTIPAQGYVRLVFSVSGDLSGLVVHFQSAVLDIDDPNLFPLVMTNIQTGQFAP
jgi:hypothetical protein